MVSVSTAFSTTKVMWRGKRGKVMWRGKELKTIERSGTNRSHASEVWPGRTRIAKRKIFQEKILYTKITSVAETEDFREKTKRRLTLN